MRDKISTVGIMKEYKVVIFIPFKITTDKDVKNESRAEERTSIWNLYVTITGMNLINTLCIACL